MTRLLRRERRLRRRGPGMNARVAAARRRQAMDRDLPGHSAGPGNAAGVAVCRPVATRQHPIAAAPPSTRAASGRPGTPPSRPDAAGSLAANTIRWVATWARRTLLIVCAAVVALAAAIHVTQPVDLPERLTVGEVAP